MLYDRPTPTMPSFVQKSGVKAGKEKVVARIIGKLVAAKHNRQLLTLEMQGFQGAEFHHISTSPMTSNLYLCCFEKNMLSTSLLRTSFKCNFGVLKNHHDSKHPCGHEVTTRSKPWTRVDSSWRGSRMKKLKSKLFNGEQAMGSGNSSRVCHHRIIDGRHWYRTNVQNNCHYDDYDDLIYVGSFFRISNFIQFQHISTKRKKGGISAVHMDRPIVSKINLALHQTPSRISPCCGCRDTSVQLPSSCSSSSTKRFRSRS